MKPRGRAVRAKGNAALTGSGRYTLSFHPAISPARQRSTPPHTAAFCRGGALKPGEGKPLAQSHSMGEAKLGLKPNMSLSRAHPPATLSLMLPVLILICGDLEAQTGETEAQDHIVYQWKEEN